MISSASINAINPQELSKATTLFHNIKNLRLQFQPGIFSEETLDQAYENHIQNILDKLESRIPLLDTDEYLKKVEIVMARHGLYDASFQQVILLCQEISPLIGDALKDLRLTHSGFINELQQTICDFVDSSNELHQQVNSKDDEINQLKDEMKSLQTTMQALDREADVHNQKIIELRQHLREAAQEINSLREGVIRSNSGNTNTSSLPVYGESTVTQNQVTSSPNKLIRSNSTSNLNNTLNNKSKQQSKFDYTFNTNDSINGDKQSIGSANRSYTNSPYPNQIAKSVNGNNNNNNTLSLQAASYNWLQLYRSDIQKALDDHRCRDITLKECKELIMKLYETKEVANQKALKRIGNIPFETLEQHTYRSLEKRYGLRSLAIEHAGMLLKAIDKYSNQDFDVLIFRKIFRNEFEEDFHHIQSELLKSIHDLTMVQCMGKNPTKDQNSLQIICDNKINNGFIIEEDWIDMVKYLYNETDSMTLISILKKLAQETIRQELESQGIFPPPQGAIYPASSVISYQTPLSTHMSITPKTTSKYYTIGGNNSNNSSQSLNNSISMSYDKSNIKDIKRLGYSSPTLKIAGIDKSKFNTNNSNNNNNNNEPLKLSFQLFIKTILEFQLKCHELYIEKFVLIFRKYDHDVDGILSAGVTSYNNDDSKSIIMLDESSEINIFLEIMSIIDPFESDRVIFSNVVGCLSKLNTSPITLQ
eukprot:gene12971-17393_t